MHGTNNAFTGLPSGFTWQPASKTRLCRLAKGPVGSRSTSLTCHLWDAVAIPTLSLGGVMKGTVQLLKLEVPKQSSAKTWHNSSILGTCTSRDMSSFGVCWLMRLSFIETQPVSLLNDMHNTEVIALAYWN